MLPAGEKSAGHCQMGSGFRSAKPASFFCFLVGRCGSTDFPIDRIIQGPGPFEVCGQDCAGSETPTRISVDGPAVSCLSVPVQQKTSFF